MTEKHTLNWAKEQISKRIAPDSESPLLEARNRGLEIALMYLNQVEVLEVIELKWEIERQGKMDQKPIVPVFVSNWIDECRAKHHTLYGAFLNAPEKVTEFLFHTGQKEEKIELFARAWLYLCEGEEETADKEDSTDKQETENKPEALRKDWIKEQLRYEDECDFYYLGSDGLRYRIVPKQDKTYRARLKLIGYGILHASEHKALIQMSE